jgi:hypothetical protein
VRISKAGDVVAGVDLLIPGPVADAKHYTLDETILSAVGSSFFEAHLRRRDP